MVDRLGRNIMRRCLLSIEGIYKLFFFGVSKTWVFPLDSTPK